jgi:hypothetical protein
VLAPVVDFSSVWVWNVSGGARVGYRPVTRPIADLSPKQIGLTLEEGQQPLRGIQVQIIGSQAHAYAPLPKTLRLLWET